MKRFIIPFSIIAFVCAPIFCISQGTTALPFLLISTTTEANGMGEAAVANHTDDPLAFVYNPAHLGMMSRTTHLAFGHNSSNWLAGLNTPDLRLTTSGVNAGVYLGSLLEDFPPIGLGVAYSRIYLNYGNAVYKIDPITGARTYYDSYESSNQYSVGIGIHSVIRASAGLTVKKIESKLANAGLGNTTLHDFGVLLDVPIADVLAKFRGTPIMISSLTAPYLDWSLGASMHNFGQESFFYQGPGDALGDRLPRLARAGMGFDVGIQFVRTDLKCKAISFKWNIEANDVLVNATGGYQSGLGDIKFFDEIILGHTNAETTKAKGWEFGLFEFLSIRGGRFEEDYTHGNRRFSTFGFSLRSGGIRNILDVLDIPTGDGEIADILLNHLDLQYAYSNLIGDGYADGYPSPLNGTKFHSFNAQIVL